MKVSIKGNVMTIEIDMQAPTPSSTGKTLMVATSHGYAGTEAKVNGKPVTVSVNAYIKP